MQIREKLGADKPAPQFQVLSQGRGGYGVLLV